MNAAELVIEVEGLTRRFGSFCAVDHVSFDVRRGEIFGFLGANGAGKTTTIRMLCGLLAPTAGKGRVLEYDLLIEWEKVKPRVGYMSQKFSLYADLTVDENLRFYGGLYGLSGRRLEDRKRFALQMAGLEGQERAVTSELSAGWKQRLALGAALLHEPELLFLDEPTAGVSPEARRRFWDLIHDLAAAGTTVFVTSHYMDEVEHCDRIALMSAGRIAVLDTPEALKRDAIGADVCEVLSEAGAASVLAALRGAPSILDVQPFGAAVHALVERAGDPEAVIRARLAAAQIEAVSVKRIEPGLEDVFIAVIGRSDR